MAKSKVSPAKLETTLRALDYKYPYYQSIGFYLEHTGYEKQIVDIMLYFSEFQYDFYLIPRLKIHVTIASGEFTTQESLRKMK